MGHWKQASAAAILGASLIVGPLLCIPATASAESVRVKDLGKLQGWRENALVGTGIVTGLAGTGDSSSNRGTRQALSNAMSQFNLNIGPEQIQSRNVAVVMVSASLSPFSREGDTLDVTVTSVGDARSLVGGSLVLTSLKAANGRVYALAQGPLSVGGYRYDANGNVVQKNHPTVGSIPGGATVEVGVTAQVVSDDHLLTFILNEPDYTTANRVAEAINRRFGAGLAQARDASGIELLVPEPQRRQLVAFVAGLEALTVEPDRRAKVVINERTGTVVSGGDVRISKVAISHGDLKLSIRSETTASQPAFIGEAGDGVRTALVTNTRIDVDERNGPGFLAGGTTVADLVQSLARLKTNTRDIISILRAVKAAGALHAELVIQ
ncbi:flagellar basal body P-ring protein FlgI [Acidovorax sp. GBBC 3334]|uniref:flagellar basal body P-ring protein FlgI n=1 Tax=Acidovorax sp. GBBC 3334 TaxID=2940496 RepID=UPI00230227F7|nr:flagellar basal body P-ring protein FlgI [Acidovorax sp. GBBC 3334]MDA8456953.1 flagellar basal body P-ring protein FlgI [Acidovorax sp. GBBC 3334]